MINRPCFTPKNTMKPGKNAKGQMVPFSVVKSATLDKKYYKTWKKKTQKDKWFHCHACTLTPLARGGQGELLSRSTSQPRKQWGATAASVWWQKITQGQASSTCMRSLRGWRGHQRHWSTWACFGHTLSLSLSLSIYIYISLSLYFSRSSLSLSICLSLSLSLSLSVSLYLSLSLSHCLSPLSMGYSHIAINLIWWLFWGFQDVMKQQEIRRSKGTKTEKLRTKKPKMKTKPP